jgi:hypothetical protein
MGVLLVFVELQVAAPTVETEEAGGGLNTNHGVNGPASFSLALAMMGG